MKNKTYPNLATGLFVKKQKTNTIHLMKIENPNGKKTIVIQDQQSENIVLEDFSPQDTHFELEVILQGTNAECHIIGRAQTQADNKKNWKITQRFQGHQQTGSLDIRGVAEGNSFLHVDGAAVIEPTSTQASAEINEKIMLFEQGKGKLIPVLRVETDDVASASHAASISPVESESLLYFASRGMTPDTAKTMVKTGFLKV